LLSICFHDEDDDRQVYDEGTVTYFTETVGNLFCTDNPSTTIEVVSSSTLI
jgi:hypothetical protein